MPKALPCTLKREAYKAEYQAEYQPKSSRYYGIKIINEDYKATDSANNTGKQKPQSLWTYAEKHSRQHQQSISYIDIEYKEHIGIYNP